MRIQNKLFLALAGTGICLVFIMLILMRWSIDRGMLEYINTRQAEQLKPVVERLAHLYSQAGGWISVKENPRTVHRLLRDVNDSDAPPSRPGIDGRGPAPERGLRPPPPRLVILDIDKSPVFGKYNENRPYNLRPIKHHEQTIGWLAIPKRREITEGFELTFIKQQRRAFILISGLVLVITFIIGWPLARHFLKPIRKITQGVSELNRGNYQQLELERSDELGQLARDINELANTLNHNEDIRKRWLADTSHELRTQVSILRGEVEAMLDGVRPIIQENIQSLHVEIRQLQKLIEDLHELNNADIGGLRYRKENIDLVALVKDQLDRHRQSFDKHDLNLQYFCEEKSLNAWVDSSRIIQLIDNLLTNSIKYTSKEGTVQIRLKQEKNLAVISISDSAPGVPDDALDKLFDHLYRVDSSRNRQSGGSGLGLAICKRIVEGHNGSIQASHCELGGIAIDITLPLNQ